MEKRGVVIEEDETKTAAEGKNCPKCGRKLTESSYCNTCGTLPFEKKPDPKEKK